MVMRVSHVEKRLASTRPYDRDGESQELRAQTPPLAVEIAIRLSNVYARFVATAIGSKNQDLGVRRRRARRRSNLDSIAHRNDLRRLYSLVAVHRQIAHAVSEEAHRGRRPEAEFPFQTGLRCADVADLQRGGRDFEDDSIHRLRVDSLRVTDLFGALDHRMSEVARSVVLKQRVADEKAVRGPKSRAFGCARTVRVGKALVSLEDVGIAGEATGGEQR